MLAPVAALDAGLSVVPAPTRCARARERRRIVGDALRRDDPRQPARATRTSACSDGDQAAGFIPGRLAIMRLSEERLRQVVDKVRRPREVDRSRWPGDVDHRHARLPAHRLLERVRVPWIYEREGHASEPCRLGRGVRAVAARATRGATGLACNVDAVHVCSAVHERTRERAELAANLEYRVTAVHELPDPRRTPRALAAVYIVGSLELRKRERRGSLVVASRCVPCSETTADTRNAMSMIGMRRRLGMDSLFTHTVNWVYNTVKYTAV